MNTPAEEQLRRGLTQLRLKGATRALRPLLDFCVLLLEANKGTNLTGATSISDVIEHLLDSLAPLQHVVLAEPVIDLGSGAGFPGIPAAIVFPGKQVVLVEPRKKRIEFLSAARERLGLSNVTVVQSSASGPGAAHLVGVAGTVLMRAVAPPERAIQMGFPLLRPGGTLLLYEGKAGTIGPHEREVARRHHSTIHVEPVTVPGSKTTRHIWRLTRNMVRP